MPTCTSLHRITMLQLCTILYQLRITQRLLWKLTSVTVFQTTPWQAIHHVMVITTQVTSDADKDSVLHLYMPSKKDNGNSQKWEFPFHQRYCLEFLTFLPSDTIVRSVIPDKADILSTACRYAISTDQIWHPHGADWAEQSVVAVFSFVPLCKVSRWFLLKKLCNTNYINYIFDITHWILVFWWKIKLHWNYTETTSDGCVRLQGMLLDSDSLHGARNFPARRKKFSCTAQKSRPLRGNGPFAGWTHAVSLVQVCCFLGASMLFPWCKYAVFDSQRCFFHETYLSPCHRLTD